MLLVRVKNDCRSQTNLISVDFCSRGVSRKCESCSFAIQTVTWSSSIVDGFPSVPVLNLLFFLGMGELLLGLVIGECDLFDSEGESITMFEAVVALPVQLYNDNPVAVATVHSSVIVFEVQIINRN